jgi:hypothetical protein
VIHYPSITPMARRRADRGTVHVMTTPRDRDAAGRARNARPRDASGRPLPRGTEGVDRVPEDLELTPDEAVTEAQRLLDAGLPFSAHEARSRCSTARPDTSPAGSARCLPGSTFPG